MTAEAVDAYLRQARTLLGTGVPATMSPGPPPTPAPASPDSWNGAAAAAAERPAELLHGHRGQLGDARDRAIQALDAGAGIAADAHRGLDSIESAWNSDKAALAPFVDTPEGQAALAQAGIQRITETQALVFDISTSFGAAAAEVADATATLPTPASGEAHDPIGADSAEGDPDSDPLSELSDDDEFGGDTTAWTGHDDDRHSAPLGGPQSASGAAGSPTTGLGSALGAMPSSGGLPSMGGAGMPMGASSGLSSLLQPISDAATSGAGAGFGEENDYDNDDELSTETGVAVVRTAERALGLPYVWGGGGTAGPSGGGFDCSGLTQWAVAQATDGQVVLPRTTYDQINMGRAVDPRHARIGDLVFSNFSAPGVPEHVQIYAGSGTVIEAQQTGVPVKYSTAPGGDIAVRRVL